MGKKMALVAAAATIAVALAGCKRQAATTTATGGGVALTGKYCSPFPSTMAAISDPAASFDDCVHRWAYVLAPSRDPADVVAQATVVACSPILASWSQQIGRGPNTGQYGSGGTPPAPDPAQQQMQAAVRRALFYVVQGRAGSCPAPPANTLFIPGGMSSSYPPAAAPPAYGR